MKTPFNLEKAKTNHGYLLILLFAGLVNNGFSQDVNVSGQTHEISSLFNSEEQLPIKLSFSNKVIRDQTNDSTYIASDLLYKEKDGTWKTIDVAIRIRGNFRRKNCYFPPLKIKIDKAVAAGTLFEGNKKLKLVFPCFNGEDMNDNVIKEFMAYKLFEVVSPYHYKTKLVTIEFTEIQGIKSIKHQLLGILIEDIKAVAKRHEGRELKKKYEAPGAGGKNFCQKQFFSFYDWQYRLFTGI